MVLLLNYTETNRFCPISSCREAARTYQKWTNWICVSIYKGGVIMKEDEKTQQKSILPLSSNKETQNKPAVKTTIVGGQPSENQRNLHSVPVGIEELLAMAAVDKDFAQALLLNRDNATTSSGVHLTATEKNILAATDNAALKIMINSIGDKIPERDRRDFLKKSAAALLAIVGGEFVTECSTSSYATKGIRPDHPNNVGKTRGICPDRPPEEPEDEKKKKRKIKGIRPDRPPKDPENEKNKKITGSRPDRPIE